MIKALYTVGLAIPTYVWANVTIEADSQEQAEALALQQVRRGDVEFEYSDWNTNEVEVDFVDEAMEATND